MRSALEKRERAGGVGQEWEREVDKQSGREIQNELTELTRLGFAASSRGFAAYRCLSFIFAERCLSLLVVAYRCLSLLIFAYRCLSLLIVACRCLSLLIVAYRCLSCLERVRAKGREAEWMIDSEWTDWTDSARLRRLVARLRRVSLLTVSLLIVAGRCLSLRFFAYRCLKV